MLSLYEYIKVYYVHNSQIQINEVKVIFTERKASLAFSLFYLDLALIPCGPVPRQTKGTVDLRCRLEKNSSMAGS